MADTTKINMGRRQMPQCEATFCLRRVDTPVARFCRRCEAKAIRALNAEFAKKAPK